MIIGTLIFILTIISLATLIKNNENYISFREYLVKYNNLHKNSYISSFLSTDSIINTYSYTIFWCNIGDVENEV